MPAIVNITAPNNQQTGVWEITETEQELLKKTTLTVEEKKILSTYKATARRLQWLAVRALLQQFRPSNPTISYFENGKPYFANHAEEISISHSGKLAAIALRKGTYPGVDAEEIHTRILKIGDRFINDTEKTYIKEATKLEQLCTIWAAKEVLYKIHPEGMLSFKENLFVHKFELGENGHITGVTKKDGKESTHSLSFKKVGNYILVYTD